MKNSHVCFIAMFVVWGCTGVGELIIKETEYELPEEYQTALSSSDTLVFVSNTNQSDTFLVKNIIRGKWQLSLSGSSYKGPYDLHEFEYIMMNNIHDTIINSRYVSMISQADRNYGEGTTDLDTSYDSLIIGIKIGTRNIWNTTYEGAPKDYLPDLKWYHQYDFTAKSLEGPVIINQAEYQNLVEFTSENEIRRVLYDYQVGILQFENSENVIWYRIP